MHPNAKGVAEITKRILPSVEQLIERVRARQAAALERLSMPRLFTALEIPGAIRLRLSLIRAPLSGAKWIEAENMHITLRFAGDIDGRTADEFADRARRASRAEPFAVTIEGVGAFGGRDPRVLWAGVEAEAASARRARIGANERAARAAGLEPERRAFKPHVTLARMRGARPRGRGALPGGERRPAHRAVHRRPVRAAVGAPGHRRTALCRGSGVPVRRGGSRRALRGAATPGLS